MPGTMTRKVLLASTVLATGLLAAGFGLHDTWNRALLVLAAGAFWLLGQRLGWRWAASTALIFFALMAVLGTWLAVPGEWLLLGWVAALSAWELEHFVRGMADAGHVEDAPELERCHLRRLLIVDGLAVLLGGLALRVKVEIGFGAAFVLALLAVFGLSRAIRFLRYEGD
ncbi:MAG: hypothetical protein JSV36_08040 [Anaerolineae bacterium]|nr:MAG: hypothetical protein JSV36_08040 [Anaerolineae bacterium]